MPWDKVIEYGLKAVKAIVGLPGRLWRFEREREKAIERNYEKELRLLKDALKDASDEGKNKINDDIQQLRDDFRLFLETQREGLFSKAFIKKMQSKRSFEAGLSELSPQDREELKAARASLDKVARKTVEAASESRK